MTDSSDEHDRTRRKQNYLFPDRTTLLLSDAMDLIKYDPGFNSFIALSLVMRNTPYHRILGVHCRAMAGDSNMVAIISGTVTRIWQCKGL